MDELQIARRTPFQPLPPSEVHGPRIAALGGKPNLPYGLDIWAPAKVLVVEWGLDDAVKVVSFRRCAWESALLALAQR